MRRKLAAVVFSLGCLQASSALALGLGELKLKSFLNEPLSASVDLLNTGSLHEDEIKVRLGTREDFKRLGLERTFFLTSIQFEVVVDDSGKARIVMTTDDPVLEPYLDFIVEARWPTGRLLREYTVLIDPPAFSEGNVVVSASERVEAVEGIPAPGKKKASDAAGGTRVDVKKSDLAPGEMPERNFNASTAGNPTPGSRYMIRRDQTLWDVASRAKPAGVSVHQTMLDIQRLNPDAFINNNINRIKAGYIIYLPSADDISKGDLEAALAEVKAQNAAWREGRDAEMAVSSRPTLRIAAEPDEADMPEQGVADADAYQPGSAVSDESGDSDSAPVSGDTAAQLAAMEQQLATLQRIVQVKDEQIAALQAALQADGAETASDDSGDVSGVGDELADAGADDDSALADSAEFDTTDADTAIGDDLSGSEQDLDSGVAEDIAAIDKTAAAVSPEPAKAEKQPAQPAGGDGGLLRYLPYAAGAAVLALAGLLLARRRRNADEDESDYDDEVEQADNDDVFADVKLRDADLAVEEQTVAPPAPVALPEEDLLPPTGATRGYGERKHDAYASDLEAADALAEADIYIAYGRHPQAIALLQNALASEPNNPVYRLKLLEIHTELNNRGSAMEQLEHIRRSGDAQSIERAEELFAGLGAAAPSPAPAAGLAAAAASEPDDGPGLPPNPLDLMRDTGDDLEAEFSGLEIETGDGGDLPDELDLSSDFESGEADSDDEELVIAADSNGMSTKLDLARAYLDMGDDDGARQILEEIMSEGSDELQAEARALLERIG